ncbi:hypothetical protein BDY19DRAFT_903161 [Irpex rosettiformis]|uniref:Uncharacterized protein n=1 Tax=Irpex rosettiformis TaxID=378272 RepID=A0ACB8UG74_9APHY|nr:hypothetical protein BDY19DRAFT_903161 [Irpex rosettiformis]
MANMPAAMKKHRICELMEHSASSLIHKLLISTPPSAHSDEMAPANSHEEDIGSHMSQKGHSTDSNTPYNEPRRRDYPPHWLTKRQRRTDSEVPGPPPPYTPTIALHASTISYNDAPTAISTPTQTPPPALPAPPVPNPHGTNVGLLVGAVVAASITIVLLAALGRYLVHRNAKKLSKSCPRFSMRVPQSAGLKVDGIDITDKAKECGDDSIGQFVYISNSDGDFEESTKGDEEYEFSIDDHEFGESGRVQRDSLHPSDHSGSISRRFSAPGALEDFKASNLLGLKGLPSSASAPASPNLAGAIDRDTSLWIQRQKAAELAQIVRMRIVREDMPVHKATLSCPDLTEGGMSAKRPTLVVNHGLGMIHAEHEVDIANTALTALENYSVASDLMTPNIPLTSLFQIDRAGKVVRLSSSPSSPSQDSLPIGSPSASDSSSSSLTEGGSDELESAIIVRMAQARSMEIKRGTLVAMDFLSTCSPPMSHSAPMLLDTIPVPSLTPRYGAPKSASFSGLNSPAPSLSPIVPSATSLSADIEQSLEERVFAYRDSGEWSKENYKLTTPGQVRALVEALAINRPVSVQDQTERGWPWPAHRQ